MMMKMMMMNYFCGIVDRRKTYPYFQLGPLSEILNIANLRHAASNIYFNRYCEHLKNIYINLLHLVLKQHQIAIQQYISINISHSNHLYTKHFPLYQQNTQDPLPATWQPSGTHIIILVQMY